MLVPGSFVCVCFFSFPKHPRRLIMNGLFITDHIISRLSCWLKKFEYKAAFTARPSDDKTRLRAGSIGLLGSCRGARATKGSTESLSFGPSARPGRPRGPSVNKALGQK